jgi:homoaconitase/3-isopropylmalate dehydratase large subunit
MMEGKKLAANTRMMVNPGSREGEGIGHVIFPEKGYAFPGALIFGTDSHTVTNSALGCVATGMGHSDIASCLAIGHNWLRVPEILRDKVFDPSRVIVVFCSSIHSRVFFCDTESCWRIGG